MIGPARRARYRAIVFAVFSSMAVLSGCGGEGDGNLNNAASGQDGGVCTRDLVAINDLLAHPVACVNDGQCPLGAYCDPSRGACDFQCVTDSACGPGGTCGCDGHCTGGSGTTGGGGSTCERNPALLAATANHACNVNADCGKGLRCDTTSHACVLGATCTTAADCGLGETCTTGACAAATCVTDADCGAGIACAGGKCQAFVPRACQFDDQCPQGARCDEASGACRYDCTSDAACPSGQACDCLGACVAPGAPSPSPLDRAVRLDVTPAYSPVIEATAGTVWTPRRIAANLLAPTATAGQAVKDVDVAVTASAGLLVACGSDTAPAAAAYATNCRLTAAWTFAASGDAQIARQYVWVKPATAAVLVGNVTFTSDALANSPAVASFTSPTPMGTVTQPVAQPPAGEYRGSLTPMGPGWYTIDTAGVLTVRPDATAAPLAASVPLRAWEIDGAGGEKIVDFYDATRMLADSGKLRASSTKFTYVDWMTAIDENAAPGATANVYRAKSVLKGLTFDALAGTMRGVLVILPRQGGDPLGFQFTLKRVGASGTCAAGCGTGLTCATDVGVCEAGTPFASGSIYDGATPLTFSDTFVQRWVAWQTAVGNAAKTVDSKFCYGRSCGYGVGWSQAGASMCPFGTWTLTPLDLTPVLLDATKVAPVSGELMCQTQTIPAGPELGSDADRAALGEKLAATPSLDMVAACMGDLVAVPPPVPTSPSTLLAQVTALYSEAWTHKTCLTPAPFTAGLSRVTAAAGYTPTAADHRFAGHLLYQWLSIHGFLAKESVQERGMADAVITGADADAAEVSANANVPSRDDLLREMERGWDLVLADPELNTLVNGTALNPDYRPNGGTGEQTVGLPVHVLETAALHLDAATDFMRQKRLATYAECMTTGSSTDRDRALKTAGRALRYAAHAESAAMWGYEKVAGRYPLLASAAQQTALCTNGSGALPAISFPFCSLDLTKTVVATPAWQARYDAALAQYRAARQRAIQAAVDLSTCANPVGVAEPAPGQAPTTNAIPLYFGDVSGMSSRFFASSDYLLNGWAIPAVERARASLDAARSAWAQKRSSETQQILTDQEVARRQDGISSSFGQQLIDACGLEGTPATAALARFSGANALSPESCFVKAPSLDCQRYLDEALTLSTEKPPQVIDVPPAIQPTPAGGCYAADSLVAVRRRLCLTNELWPYLKDRDPRLKLFTAGYKTATVTPYSSCPDSWQYITSGGVIVSWADFDRDLRFAVEPPDAGVSAALCDDSLGGQASSAPERPDIGSYAACFRGGLGEEVLGVMGARKTVRDALLSWWRAQVHYDLAATACVKKRQWIVDTNQLMRKHQEFMEAAEAARSLAGAALGPAYWPGMSIGPAVQDEEAAFQAEMNAIKNEQELYECYSEAREAKLQIDNAANAIETAMASADQHVVAFRDLQTKVRNWVADGSGALAREDGRKVPPIAFHYWLDEKVDRFNKDFAWAKELTYLSMLAVEYESQASLGLRDDILRATNPDQLLDAVRAMQQEQLSRTIDGKRPDDAHLVRSLASDILQLDDQQPTVAGERRWTKVERFQHRLWSPQYAMYDDQGVYLGQGIPFALAPDGELTYTCAEKVWQVTATIQGDGLSETAPSAPVLLLKRNQYASQWCRGQGDGSPMQTASVAPPSRLYQVDQRGGSEAAVHRYVTAHVTPWFNVPRTDLFRDAYAEGASQELAGRGLYGDYVLLFPASGLLRNGFPLSKVEDVLLRFDYLAVDNLNTGLRAADSEAAQ